jgi:beta-galactosidase
MKDLAKNRSRIKKNFNFGWKFHLGDVIDGEKFDYDDDIWRMLNLPHDWGIEGDFDSKWASSTGYLPAGIGWYRKRFTLPSNISPNKKVFIYFEGIYNNSEVWVNGTSVGKRPNGYVSFYYDITQYLNFDKDMKNCIAVRVNHEKYADSRWYTGSGIYRNVYLIITEQVYIKIWGVYAHPSVSNPKNALFVVDIPIKNERNTPVNLDITCNLQFGGRSVGHFLKKSIINPGKEKLAYGNIPVSDPKLWDIARPKLYSCVITIKENDKELDNYRISVGIRDIKFDPNRGFFLNNRNLKLKGICMHHDAGCLGAAVPIEVLSRRLDLLKKMGCNAIRTSHNPFSPDFYDLCDKKGLLVIDEIFDEWEFPKNKWIEGWNKGDPGHDGYAEDFKEWAKIDIRDQVMRDRNHPCIIMWSIGNEIDYPNDPYSHPILDSDKNPQSTARYDKDAPNAKRLGKIAKKLCKTVKKYDWTRPATAGLASVAMSNQVGYAKTLDVVGYNYQENHYEQDHIKYPRRVIYGSENKRTYDAWKYVRDNQYVLGQFLWTGIEYLGEAREFPLKHSISGLLDLAGNPKYEYYKRQAWWSNTPMVFMGVPEIIYDLNGELAGLEIHPHWNCEKDKIVDVIVYSNCQEVELFLNDKSLGIKKNRNISEREFSWTIKYETGILRAVGRIKGKNRAKFELKTSDAAYQLIAKCDKNHIRANNKDVVHIFINIADKEGNLVYLGNNKIKIQTDGPIRLLGLEDANPSNIDSYNSNERNAYKGRLLAYIQALDEGGTAKIIINSPELKSCELLIEVKK